ncbi:alpha/beta hydrolase [Lentibacter algarum]|uniref:alpha/beta hydrolase n=1 Tax=Lentibacter algarum TaxID=576131 RepID=UPI001C065F04|nr:alpha/beta hydrolase [Lentibacter algarum]MBU2981948.1 alpha/beta hydrolase [Lentibacter algarum]
MDYVFTVRRRSGNSFEPEPGASHFLKVPDNADMPSPDHKITKTAWVNEVIETARHGPQDDGPVGDILIYIHGFNTPMEVMLERQRRIRTSLESQGFEGVVISFDWPSDNKALNYLEDRVDAKQTAFRLVTEGIQSFAALQRPDCQINTHVLAHSMGAYVLREAFDDADDRPGVAAHAWSVSQLMLVSGDISASGMQAGSSKTSSMYRHCVRLTNYFNPYDEALSLSNIKRVGVSERVGRVGMPDTAPSKAVDINCGNYYRAHRGDFAGIANASHTWYFYDQRFFEDVYHTIKGDVDRDAIPGRGRGDRGNLVLLNDGSEPGPVG